MDHKHDHLRKSESSIIAQNQLENTISFDAAKQPPPFQLKIKGAPNENGLDEKDNSTKLSTANGEAAESPGENQNVKPNQTGLPNQLKAGVESLSGFSLDDVNVHYNSSKPAQLQAHAFAQGSDIHIASGQEKHLPHEAWHIVQQKQGRVQPTVQMKGAFNINDETGLEKEADEMGARALAETKTAPTRLIETSASTNAPAQLYSDILWYATVLAGISIPVIIGLVSKYGLQPVKSLLEKCYQRGQKDVNQELLMQELEEDTTTGQAEEDVAKTEGSNIPEGHLDQDPMNAPAVLEQDEAHLEIGEDPVSTKTPLPDSRGVGNWLKLANAHNLKGQERAQAKAIFSDERILYLEDFLEICRERGLLNVEKKWNELDIADLEQVIRSNPFVGIHYKDANDAHHYQYVAQKGRELVSRPAHYPNAKIWPSVNHGAVALKAWIDANADNFNVGQAATASIPHSPIPAHEAQINRDHHFNNPLDAVVIAPSSIDGIRVDDYHINAEGIIEFRHFFPI